MLDRDGYRPNVAIVIVNSKNLVFWGKRIREHAWQFPQGRHQSRVRRPSRRCTGSSRKKSGSVRSTSRSSAARASGCATRSRRTGSSANGAAAIAGQKQIWYLLRLVGRDSDVSLRATDHPEFDAWRWHDYWIPLESVIDFKRDVYRRALTELERFLHHRPQNAPPAPVRLGARGHALAVRPIPSGKRLADTFPSRPSRSCRHRASSGATPGRAPRTSRMLQISTTIVYATAFRGRLLDGRESEVERVNGIDPGDQGDDAAQRRDQAEDSRRPRPPCSVGDHLQRADEVPLAAEASARACRRSAPRWTRETSVQQVHADREAECRCRSRRPRSAPSSPSGPIAARIRM